MQRAKTARVNIPNVLSRAGRKERARTVVQASQSSMNVLGLVWNNVNFHPAVLRFTCTAVIGCNGLGLAKALGDEALPIHTLVGEVVRDAQGTILREILVVGVAAIGIGVTSHRDGSLVKLIENQGDRIESTCHFWAKAGLPTPEGDVLGHIENDVVALAGDAHACSLQFLPDERFLLVHVLTHGPSR